jgi:hypothetical protein
LVCPVNVKKGAKSKVPSTKIQDRIVRFIFKVIMLTHIVIWKYRLDVEPEVREEHVSLLRSLPSVISEIESLSVGFDVLRLPRSYHSGLVASFKDRAALEAYTVHPEHVKAANFGRTISEHVASVDFED